MTREWSVEVDAQTRFIKPLYFMIACCALVLIFNIYNYGAWVILLLLLLMLFTYLRIERGLSAPIPGVKIAQLWSKIISDSDKRRAELGDRTFAWSDDDSTDLEEMDQADQRRASTDDSGYVGRRRKRDSDDDDLWL